MSHISDIFQKRRSVYALENNIPISDDELKNIIFQSVKHVPSAFNSQSSRVLLLTKNNHIKLWKDITIKALKNVAPENNWKKTEEKINMFANAYGTVLFFEDMNTVKNLENKFPDYASNFLIWANQTSAMLQYMIWTLFAENNIGANLQHYNPLIDNDVIKTFNINPNWKLIAQMPFGSIKNQATQKTYSDENKVIIL